MENVENDIPRLFSMDKTNFVPLHSMENVLLENILYCLRRFLARCLGGLDDIYLAYSLLKRLTRRAFTDSYKKSFFNQFLPLDSIQSAITKRPNKRPEDRLSAAQFLYTFAFAPASWNVEPSNAYFSAAFLSPLNRVVARLYFKTLYDELLRRPFTAFAIARARYLDDLYQDAVLRQHVKQILIIGSGYDTRSYRFESLRRLTHQPSCWANFPALKTDLLLASNRKRTLIGSSSELSTSPLLPPFSWSSHSAYPTSPTDNDPLVLSVSTDTLLSDPLSNLSETLSHLVISPNNSWPNVSERKRGHGTASLQSSRCSSFFTGTRESTSSLPMITQHHCIPSTSDLLTQQASAVPTSSTHVSVLELDTTEIQRDKISRLIRHFGYREASRLTQGVTFVSCDLEHARQTEEVLFQHVSTMPQDTIVIIEDAIGFLSPSAVHHLFSSLHKVWCSVNFRSFFPHKSKATTGSTSPSPTKPSPASPSLKSLASEPCAPPRWSIVFDYYTDLFLQRPSVNMAQRYAIETQRRVKSVYPADPRQLATWLSIYRMQLCRMWNTAELTQTFCSEAPELYVDPAYQYPHWAHLAECIFSFPPHHELHT